MAERFVSKERVDNALAGVRRMVRIFGERELTHTEEKRYPAVVEDVLRSDERYRRDRGALPLEHAHLATQAFALLSRYVDDEPCRLDHEGFCQAHDCEPPCRNAEARRILEERQTAESGQRQ